MSSTPILIVGAGPTGLVLALRLARHGVPFRIVDKNAGPASASRALVVQARTLEFYAQLGFAQDVVDRGIKIEAVHMREGGDEVGRVDLHDMGKGLSPFPFALGFPQDDHERFLVDRLQEAGVAVDWNTTLESFTQDADAVHAVLKSRGGEERCDAEWLCGCDGARSVVRQTLKFEFPGGEYEHLYYVADVRPQGGQRPDLTVSLGSDGFALMLPVRSSGMQRLIGIARNQAEGAADLTYEDVRPSAEALLGVVAEEVNWFSTYKAHHRVAEHFGEGRCFIAGDAGHIHSPAGGQGMNTGIGDAVNLSWKLANVVQGRADRSLLDSYEAERIVFARKLVATTDTAFKAIVSQGLGGKLLRTWLMPHLMPVLTGFAGVRRGFFETISQVRLEYEDGPLSEGKAGKVRGGDRLPWVPAGDLDNFGPLRSLGWQCHSYGAPSAALAEQPKQASVSHHVFPWTPEAEQAGLEQGALYLVRPDGYVALAVAAKSTVDLAAWAARHGVRFKVDQPLPR